MMSDRWLNVSIRSLAVVKINIATVYCAITFQAFWCVCVFLGRDVHQLPLLFMAVFFTLIHVAIIDSQFRRWFVSFVLFFCGVAVDHLWLQLGVLGRADGGIFIPVWLWVLWWMFALNMPLMFAFLRRKYFLSILLGACGGTFCYWLGASVNTDISLSREVLSLFVIAMGWGVLMGVSSHFMPRLTAKDT